MGEKRYHVSGSSALNLPAITRQDEGALEIFYLAPSNDIKKGHGVTIRIKPPASDEPATGGKR
jgi:hypothetical protein